MAARFLSSLTGLLFGIGTVLGRQTSRLQHSLLPEQFAASTTADVISCPGYTLSALIETQYGLTAQLQLAGAPCNAFGSDIANLTLEVTYETKTRLHVNVFDTDDVQFKIPESTISLPPPPTTSHIDTSDLIFNYDQSPFAFWITRRDSPHATPIFDTRINSLPPTPIPPVIAGDNTTGLDGFPLVFEDQYLQLTSALPLGANIYGLGEAVASSGFRRDVGTDGGIGTIQTMWARDDADPVNQNMYGSHPMYLEHRFNETTKRSNSHGVFLYSASGSDILLLTPPSSNVSLVEYRQIGGTLDFYFFSGPSPQKVIEQYGALIGLPMWQPSFGFGFHLCRWGYANLSVVMANVEKMREANIPLEVQWTDIDLYHALRDFTTDPVSFPRERVKEFIGNLTANNQHYIPIVDAALAHTTNATDIYDPYTKGVDLDVFIKNPDGSEYIGQVWPGYTVFPDWFANNSQMFWTEALRNWSTTGGVNFSGIWLDMNEASVFCDGSCGTGADLSNTSIAQLIPGDPDDPVVDYPEGYNSSVSGPSGNITVNGTLTFGANGASSSLNKRGLGVGSQTGVNINTPPYAIHNGYGALSIRTIAPNATHAGGLRELDVHNMNGMLEERATNVALQTINPSRRPFIISRSTFPSAGRWTGHWLGDNMSKWSYLHASIQGVLQFQLFQIPFVGADSCGFIGNTDEELCNRWMQMSAFVPFYRNHNQRGALSQEPYRWDSVANATRTAIGIRYSLLPYWYTLFANASLHGTPPMRALFFEFPDEPELFANDRQFLIGRDILVTPVLEPNVTSVDGIFPGRGHTIWRDWYAHEVVNTTVGGNTTLAAPLGHINVHIRDGSAILLHDKPAYTTKETRDGPYALLVSQAADGYAFGNAYIDDGETPPPTANSTLTFHASPGILRITREGSFILRNKLAQITVLGAGAQKPTRVAVGENIVAGWTFDAGRKRLVITGLDLDLNGPTAISWQ